MLIFTGAQAVATLLISPLENAIGYTGVLIFAAIMLFICGVTYYAVAKSVKQIDEKYFTVINIDRTYVA